MKWLSVSLFLVLILVVACQPSVSPRERAIETGDWNYCLEESSELRQLSCLDRFTTRSDTPVEMCLVYGDNENGKNTCYYNLARAKDDIAICDLMTNNEHTRYSRDNCYWRFSFEAGQAGREPDPTICDKIEDSELKETCLMWATR